MAKTDEDRRTTFGVNELKTRHNEIFGRVEFRREKFILTRRGKPIAKIIPYEPEVLTDPLRHIRGDE